MTRERTADAAFGEDAGLLRLLRDRGRAASLAPVVRGAEPLLREASPLGGALVLSRATASTTGGGTLLDEPTPGEVAGLEVAGLKASGVKAAGLPAGGGSEPERVPTV